ncbi:hypothetical protein [Sphingosinicella sp. CPCC 101087]|uniref:hypothetical protein n=1 Tax=Sphingosinicella sp. CPCC 101087 TaxID=2497754 RepID=UPI00101B69DC|nr:hypothetical protein [Sphingosinicella sp. CPCC 101087]
MPGRWRRFQVSGVDSEGDVHLLETNDLARARATRDQFREDLDDVEFLEDIDLAEQMDAPESRQRRLRSEPFKGDEL